MPRTSKIKSTIRMFLISLIRQKRTLGRNAGAYAREIIRSALAREHFSRSEADRLFCWTYSWL